MRVSQVLVQLLLYALAAPSTASALSPSIIARIEVWNCAGKPLKVGVARRSDMHETLDHSANIAHGSAHSWQIITTEADVSIYKDQRWVPFEGVKSGSYRIDETVSKHKHVYELNPHLSTGCE